jgi:hypothetical protein
MMESDEEGHDAYLERMKAEGKERNEEDDEDEDSSEGKIPVNRNQAIRMN